MIQKISLDEAEAVTSKRNASGLVKVYVVDSNPMVINPNGKLLEVCCVYNYELTFRRRRCKLQRQYSFYS
jgi:hypothetical protein